MREQRSSYDQKRTEARERRERHSKGIYSPGDFESTEAKPQGRPLLVGICIALICCGIVWFLPGRGDRAGDPAPAVVATDIVQTPTPTEAPGMYRVTPAPETNQSPDAP